MGVIPGTRLGPYEILSLLGAGGMGEVYRARDERLKRDVAIKVLPASFSSDPDRLRRFEREAQAASALNHPNITAVYDIGQHEGAPYIVTELLEGETLRARLAGDSLTPRKAIDYAAQVTRGLAAAHEKGIVHRDLKPENLFVTKDSRIKILDFGLAKLTQLEETSGPQTNLPTATPGTEPGIVMGTLGYMSPEQVKGKATDGRSDIFSLGTILYEMLSGKRAFQRDSAAETMSAILKEEPPDLSATNRNIQPGLERIVHHCLEKNPEERFQSARDLAFDLEALSGLSGASPVLSSRVASSRWSVAMLIGLGAVAALTLAFFAGGRLLAPKHSAAATFRRLTFRRGNVLRSRFAPDGQTVVYSAAWEGAPAEIFTVRTDGTGSRALGIRNSDVLAVSKKGELAILLKKEPLFLSPTSGTLARVPLGGGAPREVLEDAVDADWGPDGEDLAVVRRTGEVESRLEYPIGHVLAESPGHRFSNPRISPDGRLVAVIERLDVYNYAVAVVDRAGKKRSLSTGWDLPPSLAWSPGGNEVLFVTGKESADDSLRAVDLSGRQRILLPGASDLSLADISADGRLLLQRASFHSGILYGTAGRSHETQLAWLDGSGLQALSEDGQKILLGEYGEGGGPKGDVFLRGTDGSPAIRLGDGTPTDFSPDGKWVLTKTRGTSPDLVLLPTGPGVPRKVPLPGITHFGASFSTDGRILVVDFPTKGQMQLSVVGIEGGKRRILNTKNVALEHGIISSPDGASLALGTTDHKIAVVPIAGGSSRILPGAGLEPNDVLIQWSADGRSLYLCRRGEIPARVSRLDIQTGEKTLWKELKPADASGVTDIERAIVTRDGRSYAYSYFVKDTSNLYVVSGLK